MKFEGKEVYRSAGYPVVYWPEHPVANSAGLAYVHRIVGYRKYGEDVFGNVIHHKDGNPENWSTDNLKLMTDGEHNRHHHGRKILLRCGNCGQEIKRSPSAVKENNYCSSSCVQEGQEKIKWPTTGALKEAVYQFSAVAVADLLDVSDVAVHKRIRNH